MVDKILKFVLSLILAVLAGFITTKLVAPIVIETLANLFFPDIELGIIYLAQLFSLGLLLFFTVFYFCLAYKLVFPILHSELAKVEVLKNIFGLAGLMIFGLIGVIFGGLVFFSQILLNGSIFTLIYLGSILILCLLGWKIGRMIK